MTDLGNVEDRIREPKTPDWQIELANFNVSRACQKLRFKDTISQPGEFNMELMVKPGDIEENDNFLVFKNSETVFSGLVRRPENSSSREDRYQGQGPSALLKGVPINEEYKDTDTKTIVEDVFSQISTDRISVGVNEQLNSENNSVDARADDEGALNFLNRVIMSHGGEWNTTYNEESGDFEFNVYERLETDEPVKEFRGGDDESNIRELNDKQVFDKEYDAVIVKGYGDGEDQVSAEFPARSQWPDDPMVLKHTDKTVFSEREAETKAENIYNEHVEWRNIELVPANTNEVLNLGDLVSVDEDNTGISGEFRVVQRKLNIHFGQDNELKYILSDRPINMIEEITDVQEQTKSETDYSQGNRNTLNENNDDIATPDKGLELEFNIPQNITEDLKGEDSVAKVLLDYKVKDYKKVVPAGDDPTELVDSQTTGVVASVDDYGNVQKTQTKGNKFDDEPDTSEETSGDFLSTDTDKELTAENFDIYTFTVPQYIQETGVEGIATDDDGEGTRDISFSTDFSTDEDFYDVVANYSINAPGYFGTTMDDWMYGVDENGMGVKVANGPSDDLLEIHYKAKKRYSATTKTINAEIPVSLIATDPKASGDRGDLEGIAYTVFYVNGFESDVDISFDIEFSGFSDSSGTLNINSESSASYTNYVKSDDINSGDAFTVELSNVFADINNHISSSPSTDIDTSFGVIIETISSQSHEAEASDSGVDNVVAFLEDSDGNAISGGEGGSTTPEDVPNQETVNVNELEKNEPILVEETTEATSAEVFVNGDSIGSYSTEEEDIDITSNVTKPGKNVVEIVPDSTGDIHANAIIDHKVEGDRQ